MRPIEQQITELAFGRAVIAISPYLLSELPERADAILLRVGREMSLLPDSIVRLTERAPSHDERRGESG